MAPKRRFNAFFIDYKAAFDGIRHDLLFQKMNHSSIRVLKALFNGGTAAVWVSAGLTESFPVETGVRQGCLLSPMLFAIYINDLMESLPSGISVGDVNIKVLMYADDIVILAETVDDLQLKIRGLEEYNNRWGLKLNLEKSKIMIFQRGGKTSVREHWKYRGCEIGVVGEYKYLGMLLTPRLTYSSHVLSRAAAARVGINTLYRSFFRQPNVPLNAKFQVFCAVSRAILTYGAQVWGGSRFLAVERTQLFFIKRMLGLPENTPNYVVYLETGADPIFVHTLALHCGYLLRVLKLPQRRFPRLVAEAVLERKIGWCKSLHTLAVHKGCDLEEAPANLETWRGQFNAIIERVRSTWREDMISRAQQSTSRIYRKLNFELRPGNVHEDVQRYPLWVIRWVIKLRGALIDLNCKPYDSEDDPHTICSLCNMGTKEDLTHFLAVCPVLGEIRAHFLGRWRLTGAETEGLLNGGDWFALAKYGTMAWRYRKELVTEFNW